LKLFKKKQEEVVVDTRTDIERQFEEKGQEIGRKTGTLVQKGVDKLNDIKQKLEDDGTMDKLRDFSDKVDDKIDVAIDKVSKKGVEISKKMKQKKDTPKDDKSNLFYE